MKKTLNIHLKNNDGHYIGNFLIIFSKDWIEIKQKTHSIFDYPKIFELKKIQIYGLLLIHDKQFKEIYNLVINKSYKIKKLSIFFYENKISIYELRYFPELNKFVFLIIDN